MCLRMSYLQHQVSTRDFDLSHAESTTIADRQVEQLRSELRIAQVSAEKADQLLAQAKDELVWHHHRQTSF